MFPESYLTSPLKNKTSKELVTTLEDIRGGPIIYSLLCDDTSNFLLFPLDTFFFFSIISSIYFHSFNDYFYVGEF